MVLDADPDIGMGLFKCAQHRQEQKTQSGLAGPYGQCPLVQAGHHLQFLLCGLELFHRDLYMGIEPLAFRGQCDPTVGTDQQRAAEGMLHEPDDPGQVRLVVVEELGCGGQVPASGNVIEDAVVFIIDVHDGSFAIG